MQQTNNFPNLNETEKGWLVQSAALRNDASVDDLIDSFLLVFPDRTQHDGMTPKQIRETLTSRFNDILYRKARGYAETIDNKRNEYQQIFTAAFSVLNPIALMNFYEQTFADPKSKPSDKFKAIQAAEKLNDKIFPPPTDEQLQQRIRQQNLLKEQAKNKRSKLYWRLREKRFQSVYETLDEALQTEIQTENKADRGGLADGEIMEDVLHRYGMTDEIQKLNPDISFTDCTFLSDVAILEIDERLSNGGIDQMSPDAIDALIKSYLEPERNATIETLKNP